MWGVGLWLLGCLKPRDGWIPVPRATPCPQQRLLSVRPDGARNRLLRQARRSDLGSAASQRGRHSLSGRQSLSGPGDSADLVPRFQDSVNRPVFGHSRRRRFGKPVAGAVRSGNRPCGTARWRPALNRTASCWWSRRGAWVGSHPDKSGRRNRSGDQGATAESPAAARSVRNTHPTRKTQDAPVRPGPC